MLFLLFLAAAQAWPQSPPVPPPPPEKKIEAPRPAPQPIRVGGNPQQSCWGFVGPAANWICPKLSERQMAEFEWRFRHVNAEDVCVRGQLIAHYPDTWANRQIETRVDHLLWMIRNHPEWDGFTADPSYALANPRSAQERGRLHEVKEAWLQQIGPAQTRAIVLHNAAMFFAVRERELAVALLKRAMALEPDEALYVERLGLVYGYSLVPPKCSGRDDMPDTPEFQRFAREARDTLLQSDNWVLVAGALRLDRSKGGFCNPVDLNLRARLHELQPKPDLYVRKLPSETSRYCRTDCNVTSGERP
jgi:hypothetical protein